MLKTLLSMFTRKKKFEPQANKRNQPTKAQEKRREPSVSSKNDVRSDTSSEIYLNPLHPLNPSSPAHLLDDSVDDIRVKPDSRRTYYEQDTYKETYRSNDDNETRRSYSEPSSDTGYRGGDPSPSDSSGGGDSGGGD